MIWLALALVTFADIWTTNKVIAQGGVELNPVMRFFMVRLDSVWWMPKVLISIGAVYASIYYFEVPAAAWVFISIIGAASVWNYSKIRRKNNA